MCICIKGAQHHHSLVRRQVATLCNRLRYTKHLKKPVRPFIRASQMHFSASARVAPAKTHTRAPERLIRPTAAATPFRPSPSPALSVRCNSSYATRNNGPICYYTSMPERMGEQDDNPSATVPHSNPDEQHKADEARRLRDAAAREQAVHVLHDLEAAAVTANPEAGHPENRRVLSTVDYPAPDPPATPTNSPWHSWGTTDINAHISSDLLGSEGPVEGRHAPDTDRTNLSTTGKATDSIYDDNVQFVAWFEDP